MVYMDGETRKEFDKIGVALKMINENMATKADLATMQTEMATMQTEMATMQTEMATKADLAAMRTEMATKADLAAVVTEVRAAIQEELRDVRGALHVPTTTTD